VVAGYAVELVPAGHREPPGQGLLLAPEDVDGEPPSRPEIGVGRGGVVDANEDERRIQGDGRERAGGQARRAAVPIAGRHDRDAGREAAQRGAELGRGERHQTRVEPTMRLLGLTRRAPFFTFGVPRSGAIETDRYANPHRRPRRLTMEHEERSAETPTVE